MEDKRYTSNRRFTTRREFIKETVAFAAMLSGSANGAGPWPGSRAPTRRCPTSPGQRWQRRVVADRRR